MIYSIYKAASEETHLAGAASAQEDMHGLRSLLVTQLPKNDFLYVILDYSGVETITASYARHTLGWLLQSGGLSVGREGEESLTDVGNGTMPMPLPIYPFASGLNIDVREELETALTQTVDLRLCFLEATRFTENSVTEARIVGDLEKPLLETLMMVLERGEATATDLYQASMAQGRGGINATGWNNRLADLHRLRVLRRRKEGRHWVYFPVVPSLVVNSEIASKKSN